MTEKSNRDGDTVRYDYNNDDTLAIVKDSGSGITTRYYYDDVGRDARYTETGTGRNHSVNYSYDDLGRLSVLREHVDLNSYTTTYQYDARSRLNSQTTALTAANILSVTYYYDDFGRLLNQHHLIEENGQIEPIAVLAKEFTYTDPETKITSDRVATYEVSTPVGGYSTKYSYEYDVSGNILVVRANASTTGENITSYAYDCMNQLIRENNQAGGFTYLWVYDEGGNILSRYEYAYTTGVLELDMGYPLETPLDTVDYIYDGDVLYSYDGKSVNADAARTYSYDGWAYGWGNGNRLLELRKADPDGDGDLVHAFTYDAGGMRIKREAPDGIVYNYIYNGSQLSGMTMGSNALYFTYDVDGTPLTVTHNGTTYYYSTNLQGDVVAILGNTGTAVVTYTYDAWGNIVNISGRLALTLGFLNPLRYRGYVYDTETGWYYLQSRFYNPEWGRFLTADSYVSTGQGVLGCNMFTYCGNNPIVRIDPTGRSWSELRDAFTQAFQQASGYFAVAAGVSQLDTPVLGPADVLSGVLLLGGVFVCAGIAAHTTIMASAPISKAKEKAKAEAAVIAKKTYTPVVFPVNPNDFNPVGLDKVIRPGTKNGSFISWVDRITKKEVFRWDENPNYSNGSHYHIHGTGHYYPGMIVPEPYATFYFPFR